MPNEEHVRILKEGPEVWNKWLSENPETTPDLVEADLQKANLREADLRAAELRGVDLRCADLNKADARHADLSGAQLKGADLCSADIGFWSGVDRQIKKIPVSGGAPVMLSGVGNPRGPSWEADDSIIFGLPEGIVRVSSNGGEAELLVAGDDLGSPQLLPDGHTMLFYAEGEIVVQRLDSDERTVLFPGEPPRYVSTGHIVYGIEGVLFAVPFDVGSLELRGGHVALVEGLGNSQHYAVSDSGVLVYVPSGGNIAEERTLVWVDRDGDAEPIATIPTGDYRRPRISPSGERLLIRADEDLWIYDIASGRRSAVTIDWMTLDYTAWSPDGTQVAYTSSRSGSIEAWIQPADGRTKSVTGSNSAVECQPPKLDVEA